MAISIPFFNSRACYKDMKANTTSGLLGITTQLGHILDGINNVKLRALIVARRKKYESAYSKAKENSSPIEMSEIGKQYNFFCVHLKYCLANKIVDPFYFSEKNFYAVGDIPYKKIELSTSGKLIAYSILAISGIFLASGIAAVFFIPPLGAAAIGLSLLLMAGSLAYLNNTKELDLEPIKNEEKEIFQQVIDYANSAEPDINKPSSERLPKLSSLNLH